MPFTGQRPLGTLLQVSGRVELREAIQSGDFQRARKLALEAPSVELGDALDLTLLASHAEPELYEPMARRWLARLSYERDPKPFDLARAAQLLAEVGDGSIPAVAAGRLLGQWIEVTPRRSDTTSADPDFD